MYKQVCGFVLLAWFSFLAGCASVSNFGSARALGTGKAQGFVAVSKISVLNQDTIPLIKAPDFIFFEIGATGGLTDNIDVGLKYTFPTAGAIDGKFMYLGAGRDKGIFGAVGARGGYTAFPTSDGDSTSNDRVEFAVPLYFSWYPVEFIGISIIPTYMGRFFTEGSSYTNLVGGNINFRLEKKIGFVIEAAFYQNQTWKWQEVQAGASLLFPLPKLLGLF